VFTGTTRLATGGEKKRKREKLRLLLHLFASAAISREEKREEGEEKTRNSPKRRDVPHRTDSEGKEKKKKEENADLDLGNPLAPWLTIRKRNFTGGGKKVDRAARPSEPFAGTHKKGEGGKKKKKKKTTCGLLGLHSDLRALGIGRQEERGKKEKKRSDREFAA